MIRKEFDIEIAKAITAGDIDGRIITRDGYPARIIFCEAKGTFPIVALIDEGTNEVPQCYKINGRSDSRDFVKTSDDLLIEYGPKVSTREEAIESLMDDYDKGVNLRDVLEAAMEFAEQHQKGGEV